MNIRDDFLLKNIHDGYLVGGAVRDFLMQKITYDRDIAIKNAEQFAINIAKEYDGTFIILDDENQIFRVVLNDKKNYLDISELRAPTIDEDLQMRDFTINAIAYDLKNDKFIDPTRGIEDIKIKKLRSIREENFTDDSLRILRGYRFMSVTGFEFDENLSGILKKYNTLALRPAKERIHDELMKLFGGSNASNTLLKMLDDGILEILFPFVKDMKKVPSNTHHHLNLIHHSIETVRQIEILYENSTNSEKEHLNSIDFGGYPRINHLKFSGFLHDIGKYSTWTIEESGRHRFIKHDIEGAKLAIQLLKKFKFSNKQIEYITTMIQNHIYPSHVISSPNLDDKIMMRYIRKMEDNVIDNIILAKADRLSAQGPAVTQEMISSNIEGLSKLLEFYISKKPYLEPMPKLIDGKEIMQILNISQSPVLGKIIEALHEEQLNENIVNKDDAISFIQNFYKKQYS